MTPSEKGGSLQIIDLLVDLVGIEPTTSSMPWKRAPSCATGPLCRKAFSLLSVTDVCFVKPISEEKATADNTVLSRNFCNHFDIISHRVFYMPSIKLGSIRLFLSAFFIALSLAATTAFAQVGVTSAPSQT